jgi:hypothetical protein
VTATRQGWRSALDQSILGFTVVVCSSLSLLSWSSVWSLARAGSPSLQLVNDSSGTPLSTLPADNNDVDDNDDDDDSDDDDAGALPGEAIGVIADHGATQLLTRRRHAEPLPLEWDNSSLRGPPRSNLDERTRSIACDSSGQIVQPSFWTAEDSPRQPQNSSDDTQDVDDRDERDDDDDDDGDDENAVALSITSAALTVDRTGGQRVNPLTSSTHSPLTAGNHSLRGPPRRILTNDTTPRDRDIPNPTPQLLAVPYWHWLRAPPHSLAPSHSLSRARNVIATATRRR